MLCEMDSTVGHNDSLEIGLAAQPGVRSTVHRSTTKPPQRENLGIGVRYNLLAGPLTWAAEQRDNHPLLHIAQGHGSTYSCRSITSRSNCTSLSIVDAICCDMAGVRPSIVPMRR